MLCPPVALPPRHRHFPSLDPLPVFHKRSELAVPLEQPSDKGVEELARGQLPNELGREITVVANSNHVITGGGLL
jgi:hypothetical protein